MLKENKINQKLKFLPSSPGVYIFKNKSGNVLYVGKAGSLKDRLGSYFNLTPCLAGRQAAFSLVRRKGNLRPIEIMMHEVKDIEIRKTDMVLEAYILEQELIKKFQPKYNMMSKDDKSFCYVLITEEDYPRFIIVRKTELEKVKSQRSKFKSASQKSKVDKEIQNTIYKILYTKFYGPYTSKYQIETALKILRKIFPYHSRKEKTEKGCLDLQIGLCPGPYNGTITKEEYRRNIRGIKMILEGKKKGLIGKMKKEMEEYSARHEYEKAAEVRNKLFALQHVQDVALLTVNSEQETVNRKEKIRIEGYDISNISGKWTTGSMVVFDNSDGEMKPNKSQYRKFKIKTIKGANDVGTMEEMLIRRLKNNWPRPNLIILDGGAGHLNMARRILRNYKLEIPLLACAKGPKRKKIDIRSFGNFPKMDKKIISQVRDEAHRFAIKYHRNLRNREIR